MSFAKQLQTVSNERSSDPALPVDKVSRNEMVIGNLEAKKSVKFLDATKHPDLVELIDQTDYVDKAAEVINAITKAKKANQALSKKAIYIAQNYSLDYDGAVRLAQDIKSYEEQKEKQATFDDMLAQDKRKAFK
jgi:hypothetical protein